MRAEREEQMERGLWDYGKGGEGAGKDGRLREEAS